MSKGYTVRKKSSLLQTGTHSAYDEREGISALYFIFPGQQHGGLNLCFTTTDIPNFPPSHVTVSVFWGSSTIKGISWEQMCTRRIYFQPPR